MIHYCNTEGIQQGRTDADPVTTGKVMNMMELSEVQGRPWDDVDVRHLKVHGFEQKNQSTNSLASTE